ncbi:MAG: CPBP family intramembrane metalloprotease [Actinobacteria bacterium]|nr:CPBP family intramembrane metalloprotease [Actinomycetota bacterium]
MAMGGIAEERSERDPARSSKLAGWFVLVAALATLNYAGRLSGGKPESDVLYRYETAIGSVIIYAILLAIVVFGIGRGLPKADFFALRRPRSWRSALGWALAGYVAIFAGAGLLLLLLEAGDEQGLTPDGWDSSRAGAYAASFVAIALVGPIVEELLYRGAGIALLLRFGPWLAVVATAICFGLGHGLLLALPALVVFGLVTGFVRLRTDSIYPSILIHCAFNATSLIVAVTT